MPEDAVDKYSEQKPTNLRLLLLLEAVVEIGGAVKPSQIGEALGLPKPTVHRLIKTAEDAGFLRRDIDGRSYGPGARLQRLSANTFTAAQVQLSRSAILRKLSEQIGETCNLSTPDRDGMMYLDRHETAWPLRIQLPTGTTVPFHATASGKMYLASLSPQQVQQTLDIVGTQPLTHSTLSHAEDLTHELAKIRSQGYATDNEEFMVGMVALALPVKDPKGRLMSTVSIHAPVQRLNLNQLLTHLPKLKDAAAQLSALVA
ncbi:MAG: IclR family transcriptional regulator [Pseudomonadota bacterium]